MLLVEKVGQNVIKRVSWRRGPEIPFLSPASNIVFRGVGQTELGRRALSKDDLKHFYASRLRFSVIDN